MTASIRMLPFALGGALLLAALALYMPGMFMNVGALGVLAVCGAVALLFPSTVLALAILSLVLSPENLIRQDIGVEIQSLHKAVVLMALIANLMRYGISRQFNTPMVALGAIFLISLLLSHIHPALTRFEMLKSLIAFAMPFVFLSVQYRRTAIERMLLMVALMPLASIAIGAVAEFAGIWSVFRSEYTGAVRLQGMNIAAYLAYFAFVATFVSVFEGVRNHDRRFYALAGLNLSILVLTGTRTPFLAAGLFCVFVVLFTKNELFRARSKLNIAIFAFIVVSIILAIYWPQMEARFFGSSRPGLVNLSGRDEIWAQYWDAFQRFPWFGQGIGAGKFVITDFGFLGSGAAHNEYLRMLVDVGVVGLVIYLAAIVMWLRREGRSLPRDERTMLVGFFISFAIYSFTDNTLTAPPALVAFFAVALIHNRVWYDERDYLLALALDERQAGESEDLTGTTTWPSASRW